MMQYSKKVKILLEKLSEKWDLKYRLSTNFTLGEMLLGTNNFLLESLFSKKDYLDRDQIIFLEAITEELNDEIVANLTRLCLLLEIIRAYLKESTTVLCGYRPLKWERYRGRTGGSKHVTGEAADINFIKASLQYVYDWLNKNILTGGRGYNPNQRFIHVDIRPNFAEWNY